MFSTKRICGSLCFPYPPQEHAWITDPARGRVLSPEGGSSWGLTQTDPREGQNKDVPWWLFMDDG